MNGGAVAVLSGVTHRYGKVAALQALDLSIPAGVMAGLIGPDGVGKSTLLALVAGVRHCQQGRIATLDGDLADRRHREDCLARIAYMPQGLGRNLYPTLTVAENLEFAARLFAQPAAERRARMAELLRATGLDPFPDRPAGKLSGGMRQKLSLCCALIHDPDLLILDEPTTGVDPLSRRQFWELIDRLRARRPGMSVIVATAYMEEAQRFDWIAALDGGRLLAAGPPAELLRQAGATNLEEAFIRLLPEERRRGYEPVGVPPRQDGEAPLAIEADGLTLRFGSFTAVDHVSFGIRRGEIFGFLGSNGCGKTTTMKMLTGLLRPSEGEARLFGKPLDAGDMETRRRVGYMSQSFSLYSELSVRRNLALHAGLFHLPRHEAEARIEELLDTFELREQADSLPDDLPLGLRQRLQLAVAVLHKPDILILDEPTSGVDPVARDGFWRLLIGLARDQGVTLFISTHFMNEAERCDRISLMHAGRVLAVGEPAELVRRRGAATLEEAFIAYLEEASQQGGQKPDEAPAPVFAAAPPAGQRRAAERFHPARWWACARREALEIRRDPIRLVFALLGPVILMLTFGFGISFDVDDLAYGVFDQDQSYESRLVDEAFSGSRTFQAQAPVTDPASLDRRLLSSDIKFAVEFPADFGRKLLRGESPELAIWIDGAMPFRAETTRGYVLGALNRELRLIAAESPTIAAQDDYSLTNRFRYNQAFKSAPAIVPGVVMLMLMLIPAMMTAVAVVREKETGSIANFRSTPLRHLEFLTGKQAPYVAIASISFATMVLLARFVFDVPVKGSALALGLGTFLYLLASTGFGLLVSSFTRSQIAAIFATAIISITPAVNFSGLLTPVSSLSGGGRIIGLLFPAGWYQQISVGTFTKGLDLAQLWHNHVALAAFAVFYIVAARLCLPKQER